MTKIIMIQKKLYYCVTLCSLWLFFACSAPQEESEKIDNTHFSDISNELTEFANEYNIALVLSKKGCTGCNKKIVKIAESHIASEKFGAIIETTGRNYDISNLLVDDLSDKIFKDYKSQLSKKLNAESSFFLYYPNGIEGEGVEKHEITVKNMDSFEDLLKMYLAKVKP